MSNMVYSPGLLHISWVGYLLTFTLCVLIPTSFLICHLYLPEKVWEINFLRSCMSHVTQLIDWLGIEFQVVNNFSLELC